MKQLIIGGARSGKSGLAQQLATTSGKHVVYIATANARLNDSEMSQRIIRHQQERPGHWQTIEEPTQLATVLQQYAAEDHCLMVDCLTLWLSNCLLINEELWQKQRQALFDIIGALPGDIILVGNEVGSGVIPLGEINRQFVDENGFLHQSLTSQCDRVIFMAAGLPLVMKGESL